MHIQPEILCAGVPGELLDHGQLTLILTEKYLMEGIMDRYSLLSVACMNSGNWNGEVLVRILIFSLSSSAWAAGYGLT